MTQALPRHPSYKNQPTAKLVTKQYGEIEVFAGRDIAGNFRLHPVYCVSLAAWPENKNLVPPIVLDGDCVNPDDWSKTRQALWT